MMSANPKMAEQLKLHQRWEFRRKDNDSDSSSNDSKPSGEPALKTYKLISSFISVDNEETSEASKLHQNGSTSDQTSWKSGKAENGRRRRKSKRDDSAPNEIKKGPRKGVRRKKSKTITDEQAVFHDLKKYMNFLLEDLKVSRENLLKWMREEMQKLVAEETVSELETRERSFRGEKVQLQNQTNFEENAEVQHRNIFEKNIPAQHQNNIQGYGQLQAHKEFEENVHGQNLINFKNSEAHHQETIFLQNQNAFKSFKGAQDCNDESTERFGETNKSADFSNCILSLDSQAGYSRANVPSSRIEKDREERMALSARLNSKPNSSDQNVQVQQLNSIVLGIRAQSDNKSSERSAKGRKNSDSNSHRQVPEHQSDCAQVIGSLTSTKRDKGERLPLSVQPMFPANSNQVASSMYLTLPTVLTKPHVANHRFDTSSLNSIQPRLAGNQIGLSSERPNLLLGSSSHHGYFQDMQPEERSRNFAQVSSRDISYFNQNSTSPIVGNGLPDPLLQAVNSNFNIPAHVSLENLARESSMPSLSMSGGATRLPGGSHSFSEQFIASNFLNHSSYKVDGRLMAYQDGYLFQK
ncbi:PREDICTED: uncharacterized protein LOC105124373 [Populus euphratica]|uniref:Uncharacterized protein LOC105124373 n=1 Tax=Populus euphratica TaxID=75702 RepID=A0AAJ6XKU9_POPEU|nr:PREDICTED: uncharacterized protein LOC105124373 [Populus euphratica]